MSSPKSRLQSLASHFLPSSTSLPLIPPHIHTLSPTSFLPRAAAIEPDAEAIFHVTANGKTLRRSYAEFADRARGLAYFLKKHGLQRVGILAPNTPAFLEAIFGIAAAGGESPLPIILLSLWLWDLGEFQEWDCGRVGELKGSSENAFDRDETDEI
jgi:non-ribosomal peptide synthetase component F